jgi:hypothetical protein
MGISKLASLCLWVVILQACVAGIGWPTRNGPCSSRGWLALYHCDKISEKNQFTRGKSLFRSRFQRFQARAAWPHHCGPVVRQSIMADWVWRSREVHLMVDRKQRQWRGRGGDKV